MEGDIEAKAWFRLLSEWRRRGRRGLTLPFLVGSVLREQGKDQGARSDIWSLLDDISGQDDDQRIVVFGWCADSRMPLLHLEYAEHRLYLDLFEPSDGFFVIEKTLRSYLQVPNHGKAELLEVLVQHAEPPVNEGRYSLKKVAGEWVFESFDEEDIRLIDEALWS